MVSEGQDQRVGDTLPGLPGLERRQDVMASEAEGLDHREREILVGVEAGHRSGSLVLLDLPIDLLAMGEDVTPGIDEILRPQRGIGS